MKYKITLNNKVYEVEVEKGGAILLDEYEAAAPAAQAAPAAAPAPVAAPAPAPAAPVAAPAPAPAPAPVAAAEGTQVTSPLPGTVVALKANVGDTVQAGQVIVLIEAMKMENEIVAPVAGKLLQIAVKQGDSVESGALLAVIG